MVVLASLSSWPKVMGDTPTSVFPGSCWNRKWDMNKLLGGKSLGGYGGRGRSEHQQMCCIPKVSLQTLGFETRFIFQQCFFLCSHAFFFQITNIYWVPTIEGTETTRKNKPTFLQAGEASVLNKPMQWNSGVGAKFCRGSVGVKSGVINTPELLLFLPLLHQLQAPISYCAAY